MLRLYKAKVRDTLAWKTTTLCAHTANAHAGRVRTKLGLLQTFTPSFHHFLFLCLGQSLLHAATTLAIERRLPREHMNPSPTYGGIQVQVKLSRPRSSSHMAFSSHGMPATPVQSSAGRKYEGVNDFLVYVVQKVVS